MNSLVQYFKDSKLELKKVVWPTRKQTLNHTVLVIGFSVALALFLGLVDFGLSELVKIVVTK
ncbi:preprotein translocase subunit SecE [Candidatus Kuenenbacteria bacterium RIFCSPHIGHO2_12_FULL_42_14]|uniref:Protein translocase subunit SecE n=4 Tax=Candidatus Kueneniibacteriota TaxID=1752740 RepID=A0A0G1BXI1_9BACT|nr:MAG: Preprotein translocase, SecE subunit [Candidatus Kuenenbacteria bacterium GW2011_GWA2_42_15]OGG89613.1 MAG: preprotein translocase subunit SecE [Candidatus Kuenenbacteria bacterium RIFCSPHIGHO2_02_FULL_42_29]OGG91550.1 MAG: preprotein translocase subunit SecE [Candidatus Kuenenbacteria bacterium RIFCSPLOWO2_02_FULL_42_16]OGG95598.1 MAG: preprotein translocase subunit SecE [Candidatus Kuenenbacteria bacterium RBG_16_41_7]OGG98442.1 MAG: preprotein translocase subunit SecE [Candidatus Kue